MPDYQKMYHSLFNDVTDTISKLQHAQQKTEEMYMNSKEPDLTMLRGSASEEKTKDMLDSNPPPTKKKPPSRNER